MRERLTHKARRMATGEKILSAGISTKENGSLTNNVDGVEPLSSQVVSM
jgi:hypothetical protein